MRIHQFESLERRRLLCADHGAADAAAGQAGAGEALTHVVQKGKVVDHSTAWYKATGKTIIKAATATRTTAVKSSAVKAVAATVTTAAITVATNAAGLPLLTSRADGLGLKIFLDFDGYGTDTPFSLDADGTTFNATEQTTIYNAWRDIVSYFSAFNVNVTTVQPPTGGTNPVFVWQRIVNNLSGGAAYVGAINNTSSMGYTDAGNAVSRTSGIAHEIGHQLNLQHQSDWDNDGDEVNNYSSGWTAHGPIMGVDYAQYVHKWFYGRNTITADTFQDDVAKISAYIVSKYGSGDGFMPDDFTGTAFATATALPLTNGAYQTSGVIERATDADYFSFTSAGGTFSINVEPTFESAIAPKVELYDAGGNLVAAKDDTSFRGGLDNASVDFTLNLPAGTYYAKISGHGDYGDIGEYAFYASPLPAGWNTVDVRNTATGRGGYVTYDAATGTFYQGGSGADIASTADAFRFVYQVLNGNGSITARVTGLDNTDASAKAGLMVRESLAYNSKFALIAFKPTGSTYVARTTNGGTATTTATALSLPNWIRLTRSGNSITLSQSTDGVTFTTTATVSLSALATQVYIGTAVTSKNVNQIATATFTNVALTGTLGATPQTFNALPAPTGLTATAVSTQSTAMVLNWNDVAGETGFAIERSVDGVNWSQIATTAANVITYTDTQSFGSMRWWYRVSATDGTGKSAYSSVASVVNKPAAPTNPQAVAISTTKLSLTWRDTSGDTGYRVEQSTNGGSSYTTLTTLPANIVGYNITGLAANTSYTYRVTPLSAVGDGVPLVFNGITALPAVTNFVFTSKAATAIGLSWSDLAVETGYRLERSTDKTTWATVASLAANVTTYTDITASPLTHYYYRIFGTISGSESVNGTIIFAATPAATANPSPWVDVDIGAPGGSGAGSIAGGTATVIGGGANAGVDTTDQFNFLYRTLTGDGEITTRVTGLEAVNDLSKAGVMMRETLAADAKFADVVFQPSTGTGGTDFDWRKTVAADATVTDGPTTNASYLKLVRSGSLFTGYYSGTGAAGTWTAIGSVTISMASTIYVGLCVTARDNTMLTKATFSGVSITPASLASATSLVVNDGAVQRSRVTSLTLSFSRAVNLASNAVTLWRQSSAGATAVQVSGLVLTPASGASVYTITFPGSGFDSASLADGLYELRVAATGVTDADGFAIAADASYTFHRLFADADGNRRVDFNDFLQFQTAYGSTAGTVTFTPEFDQDNNSLIDFNDFLSLQSNYGLVL